MRKRVFPRIFWFLLLNCGVFILLAAVQFSRQSGFTLRMGDMMVSGRYAADADMALATRPLNGGARVTFGGLEFRLESAVLLSLGDHLVTLTLPDDTALVFTVTDSASELKIAAQFARDDAVIDIPFKVLRSAMARDNDAVTVLYRGGRYQFSRAARGLEVGRLTLAAAAPSIAYRAVGEKKAFSPADFIIPQADTAQAYSTLLASWVTRGFARWGQMGGSQTDEDTVVAWCGEAVRQGSYRTAAAVVPVSFSTDPQRTWESAVYQFDRRIGVWERAARALGVFERAQESRLNAALAQRDGAVFIERHLVEFLTVRGYNDALAALLAFAREFDPQAMSLAMVPGILENGLNMDRWHPHADNPFAPLAEQAFRLIAAEMRREGNRVFVLADARADSAFNLRLGLAVQKWGERTGNDEWAGVGRSLTLSVLSLGGDDGSVPVLAAGDAGEAAERISAARLYRLLNDNTYLPHAAATGANGIWAWTAASSVNISRTDTVMDIAIQFPIGETHYVMLRNVPPFPLLQIYEVNWRRAVDFESYYNSSGWYYLEQERTLVIKINQRSNTENVRVYFTAPRAPEPEVQPETENQAEQWQ